MAIIRPLVTRVFVEYDWCNNTSLATRLLPSVPVQLVFSSSLGTLVIGSNIIIGYDIDAINDSVGGLNIALHFTVP
jgi:hypothetical protein